MFGDSRPPQLEEWVEQRRLRTSESDLKQKKKKPAEGQQREQEI